eukprot:808919-Pyramimonas_sp.AAC.1
MPYISIFLSGFVGRSCLENITLLDTASRILGMPDQARERHLILFLSDFGNAFPSLAHIFLWE